jgi:hypothetical protein
MQSDGIYEMAYANLGPVNLYVSAPESMRGNGVNDIY